MCFGANPGVRSPSARYFHCASLRKCTLHLSVNTATLFLCRPCQASSPVVSCADRTVASGRAPPAAFKCYGEKLQEVTCVRSSLQQSTMLRYVTALALGLLLHNQLFTLLPGTR